MDLYQLPYIGSLYSTLYSITASGLGQDPSCCIGHWHWDLFISLHDFKMNIHVNTSFIVDLFLLIDHLCTPSLYF